MRILICSDGTDPADKPVLLAALVAGPTNAETTLLGITEKPTDEQPLRTALESEAEKLRRFGISPETAAGAGGPLRENFGPTQNKRCHMTSLRGGRPETQRAP